MPMRYLDPKNDVTFKKIFAEHAELLVDFLNAILPLPGDSPIVTIEYLSPEQSPDIPIFKSTIVDIRCCDAQNRQFVVEMQMDWTAAFMSRMVFNASKAYIKQLERGEDYKLLQPVYGVSLL